MRVRCIAPAAALLVACVFATPAPANDDLLEALPLPERLDRALRDMMEDVQPTLEDALDYLRSFGAIDDPRHYGMPEVLPNGDIIIRRHQDAPELRPDERDQPDAPPTGEPPYDPEEGVRI